jgi:hypothetical protein
MPYVVKWVPVGERNLREPATFAAPSEAVDFAWYLDRGSGQYSHGPGRAHAKL